MNNKRYFNNHVFFLCLLLLPAVAYGQEQSAAEQNPLSEVLLHNVPSNPVQPASPVKQPDTSHVPADVVDGVNAQLDVIKKQFEETLKQLSQGVNKPAANDAGTPKEKAQEVDEGFGNILNIFSHLDEAEELKKATETHGRMLAGLPEALRVRVEKTCNLYGEFSKSLKMSWCFSVLCQAVLQDVGQAVDDTIDKPGCLKALQALDEALRNGSFMDLVAPQSPSLQTMLSSVIGTLFSTQSAAKKKGSFSPQDLTQVRQKLEELHSYCTSHDTTQKFPGLRTQVAFLLSLIKHAELGQTKELCAACIELVQPAMNLVVTQLNEVITTLSEAKADQTDPKVKAALDYWVAYLDNNLQTIYAFKKLTWNAQWDLSPLLSFMSNVYEVLDAFFQANRVDIFGRSNALDAALRGSIVVMAFGHQYSQAAGQAIQEYLKGSTSLQSRVNLPGFNEEQVQSIDPFGPWLNKIGLFVTTLQLVFNPAVFGHGMSLFEKTLYRVFVALSVHYTKNGTSELWPSEDKLLRIALIAAIKEMQANFSYKLQNAIESNSDPIVLENLEKFSMGLIKPQLVCETLRLAVLLCLLNGNATTNKIAKFDADDIFCYNPLFYYLMHKNYRTYCNRVGEKNAASLDVYLKNNAGFFVEYFAVHYVFSNVGAYWGKVIGKAFKEPITNQVSKVVTSFFGGTMASVDALSNALEGGNLASLFTPEAMNQTAPKRSSFEQFKRIVSSFFNERGMQRTLMVSWLKNKGLIDQDITDPQQINRCIIKQLLYYLIKFKMLSHSQSAELLEQFDHNKRNMSVFLDILFENLKESFAGAVGGIGGQIVGTGLAESLLWWKGPLFVTERA